MAEGYGSGTGFFSSIRIRSSKNYGSESDRKTLFCRILKHLSMSSSIFLCLFRPARPDGAHRHARVALPGLWQEVQAQVRP